MLLAIDVGNTTVSVGLFKKEGPLLYTKKFATKKPASDAYYLLNLRDITRNRSIGGVIISSVVPDAARSLKAIFTRYFRIRPVVLGENLIVPMKNLYDNPSQVGQDRLVNAYAGYKKYGPGLIIIDFGTAITFDVISKKGEYLGGIITPGIETGLSALSQKAALLPKVKLAKPGALIGKDTVTSMLSGTANGYGELCNGLVARINKARSTRHKVILTGGHARFMSEYCRHDYLDPELTLCGLNMLFHASLLTKRKS